MADNLVMEEREEFMISPSGGHVCLRKGHFLKPSVTSINGPVVPPSLSCSATRLVEYKDLPLKVNYRGWCRQPSESWKTWVDQMHTLHHSSWERAGILDAIMSSTFIIHKYDDLISGFVEKWCPTTNSFVFPWGEATITLEDMMVLGGYSVMGESILIPPGDGEIAEAVKKLDKARSNISKSKARKADRSKWVAQFMGRGSEIEHEAFLAYWLSRFVFPFWHNTIGKSILSIAVHLARGTQIALAPAVLAMIYKNLTHLKASIIAVKKSGTNSVVEVTVSAQLALVQVWIWERFTCLRPKPKSIGHDEPRLARWHNLKLGSEYRSLTIDSAGKDFVWRPYITRKSNVKIYMENECWAKVDCNVDGDLEGFVRCVRASELVSLEENCIQHYLPHRVSMQFGLDQDLPGHVARVNVNPDIAWRDYTRPISDVKLYVPPLVFEPCVTTRYSKWWKKMNLSWSRVADPGADGKTFCDDSNVEVKKEIFGMKLEDDYLPPPPGFSPKRKRVEETGSSGIAEQFQGEQVVQRQSPLYSADSNGGKGSSNRSKRPRESVESLDYSDSVYPLGFPAKHRQVESPSHYSSRIEKEETQLSISGNDQSQDDAQGDNHLSSEANNENIREEILSVEPVESEVECTLTSEVHSCRSRPARLEIEEKLRNIEKLCALIKAGRISLPSMKIPNT